MVNNNHEYVFASATLETEEGLKVDVGCEFDEETRNVEIFINSRNIDEDFILEDLQDIYKPQDCFADHDAEGEDEQYTRIQLFFDPVKMTDECELNETLLDIIFHLHCYWSGKLTIENF